MQERIQKFRALGTNKQVSSSSICKYNLLRKVDTLLESLYRPGKVSRLLIASASTEMEKMYTIQKKKQMYIIY